MGKDPDYKATKKADVNTRQHYPRKAKSVLTTIMKNDWVHGVLIVVMLGNRSQEQIKVKVIWNSHSPSSLAVRLMCWTHTQTHITVS